MLLSWIIKGSKFIIGAAFAGVLMLALLFTVLDLVQNPPQPTAEEEFHEHPKKLALASDGPLGKFDNRQLQRGFQVYSEVCAACHTLGLATFRELKGIGYTDAEVKKIALDFDAKAKQPTYDAKTGERGERSNTPADHFPHIPYAGNGTPPDLTLITKARHDGGAYVYSLLTGYHDQVGYKNEKGQELLKEFPAVKTPEGLYFNPYFANLNLAMPKPLTADGQVEYKDGTRATVDQMAKDVSAFLVWSAEPTAQTRKSVGLAVVLFLLLTTLLAFGAYRSVWADKAH
jgi:ubiquinol-cytochrome c reductase cytochrome c1 subunit